MTSYLIVFIVNTLFVTVTDSLYPLSCKSLQCNTCRNWICCWLPKVVTDCVGKYALSYDFKHFINSYTCRKNRTIRDVMCKLQCVIQVLYNMKTPSKFLANRLSLGHPSMWWLRYFLQCLALSVFSWCKRTDLFTKWCWC